MRKSWSARALCATRVSLGRGNRGRNDWRNRRRWWRSWWTGGRVRHHGPNNGKHHATRHERDEQFKAASRRWLSRYARKRNRILGNRLARTVICAIVETSTGN